MEHLYEVVLEWVQGAMTQETTQGAIAAALGILFLRVVVALTWGKKSAAASFSPLGTSALRRFDDLDLENVTGGPVEFYGNKVGNKLYFTKKGLVQIEGYAINQFLTRKENKAVRRKISEVIVKLGERDKQRTMAKLVGPVAAAPATTIAGFTAEQTEALKKLLATGVIGVTQSSDPWYHAKEALKKSIIANGRQWDDISTLAGRTGLSIEQVRACVFDKNMFCETVVGTVMNYNLKA